MMVHSYCHNYMYLFLTQHLFYILFFSIYLFELKKTVIFVL